MNPNLEYAQAIHGRFTGRGTGIIDTIHLVEVARAVEVLAPALSEAIWQRLKQMVRRLHHVDDHASANGIAERDATNNHGTCWVMQVAAFAHLTGDQKTLAYVHRPVQDRAVAESGWPPTAAFRRR